MDDSSSLDEVLASARTVGVLIAPLRIRIAQTVGVTVTAFLAGQLASASYVLLPLIMQSPAPLLARQWNAMFDQSKKIGPPTLIGLTALFTWLAYKEPSTRTNQFRFYALAASLIPATIPYTFIFVRPTISALQGRAAHFNAMQKSSTSTTLSKATESGSGMWHETSAADTGPSGAPSNARSTFSEFVNTAMSRSGPSINEMTVHQLVDRWGWLNLGTAAIPLAGALCALWAIVNQELSVFAFLPGAKA